MRSRPFRFAKTLRRPATGRASLNGRAPRSDDAKPEQRFSGSAERFRSEWTDRLLRPQIDPNSRGGSAALSSTAGAGLFVCVGNDARAGRSVRDNTFSRGALSVSASLEAWRIGSWRLGATWLPESRRSRMLRNAPFVRHDATPSGRDITISIRVSISLPLRSDVDDRTIVEPRLDLLGRHADADVVPAARLELDRLRGLVLRRIHAVDARQAHHAPAPAAEDERAEDLARRET